jgi:hypothetical protein
MKRRFIVCIDQATSEQQNLLTQFLKNKGVGYWHWFSDLWLVTDTTLQISANSLRDEINTILPGAHKLVVQIDGQQTWSGFGPTQMFNWLKNTWS